MLLRMCTFNIPSFVDADYGAYGERINPEFTVTIHDSRCLEGEFPMRCLV